MINYYEYLASEEWQRVRQWALALYGGKCHVCNTKRNINVHHKTYERLGKELPDDLMLLCETHHKEYHEKGILPETPKEQITLTDIEVLSKFYQELKDIYNNNFTKQIFNCEIHPTLEEKEQCIYDIKKKIIQVDIKIQEDNFTKEFANSQNNINTIGILEKIRDLQKLKNTLLSDKQKLLDYFDLNHKGLF